MYLVTIENGEEKIVINEMSVDTVNRIEGTIKQGINTIDSFTFTIYPNNAGYFFIYPFKTVVKVLNTKTQKYEFIGRVLKQTGTMDSDGTISKEYVCESELAYLIDSVQLYSENKMSLEGYLKKMLNRHNEGMEEKKKIYLGNVTVKDNNDKVYKYLKYDTTWKNIQDDLLGTYGGELKLRYEGETKYLDYLVDIGETKETEIRLSKNMKDITSELDPTSYITRIIPLGKKISVKGKDSEERLTIKSVNSNIYIDDTEGIEQFGVIEGIVIWDEVAEASNLLRKGAEYLKAQRIVTSNKVTALDLSLIGLDIDSFDVGNYYPLIHELLGIDSQIRVIEKTISIDNPENISITLGSERSDIKKYQLDSKKQNNNELMERFNQLSETVVFLGEEFTTTSENTNTQLGEAISIMNQQAIAIEELTARIEKLEAGGEGNIDG